MIAMKQMLNQHKTKIIAVSLVVLLVLAALLAWASFHPLALRTTRTFIMRVHHSDGTMASAQVKTHERILWDALEPTGYLAVNWYDGQYLIWAIDGEIADADQGQYWYCSANYGDYFNNLQTWLIRNNDVYDFYVVNAVEGA